MPGIALTVSGTPSDTLRQELVTRVSRLTCDVLDKRFDETFVIVKPVPHDHWFIAGRSLSDLDRNSFRLEVTISDETNTRAQKKTFQRAAYELLSELIGNVHPHSNIRLIDCRPTAYGYNGITQAERFEQTSDT